MSKERARRRAIREAQREAAQQVRLRREARRAWRRALLRRLTPKPRRWAWGLGRRSSGQRAFLVGVALAALGGIWYFVESWPARVALWVLVLLALPLVAVVFFDRKGLRL
jgi:Flp pilus assembly protein TadB